MSDTTFDIKHEHPSDRPALDRLCARSLGPGRFARTAYRIREGTTPVAMLSFTGWRKGTLAGTIRFTALTIGDGDGALLLGPLAVDPEFAGQGCGSALIRRGLEAGKLEGYRLVLLVGDLAYYEKSGFRQVPPGQITLPGPVDPARLLAFELEEGALEKLSGMVDAKRS